MMTQGFKAEPTEVDCDGLDKALVQETEVPPNPLILV